MRSRYRQWHPSHATTCGISAAQTHAPSVPPPVHVHRDWTWERGKSQEAAGAKRFHDSLSVAQHGHRACGRRSGGPYSSRGSVKNDRGSRSHRKKDLGKIPVENHDQVMGSLGLKRTVLVPDGEPAIQGLTTTVEMQGRENCRAGKQRYDSKSKGACGECAPVSARIAVCTSGIVGQRH